MKKILVSGTALFGLAALTACGPQTAVDTLEVADTTLMPATAMTAQPVYGAAPVPQAVPFPVALETEQTANYYSDNSRSLVPEALMRQDFVSAYPTTAYSVPSDTSLYGTGYYAAQGMPRFARAADAVSAPQMPLYNPMYPGAVYPGVASAYAAMPQQPGTIVPMMPVGQPIITGVQTTALTTVDLPVGAAQTFNPAELPAASSVRSVRIDPRRDLTLGEFAAAQVASLEAFPYADPRRQVKTPSALRGQLLPKTMRFIPGDLQANVLRDYGWDAQDPTDPFRDHMTIGAQLGTPVVSPVQGIISMIKFDADGNSRISIRANGLEYDFRGLDVARHLRVGQPISPDVILGGVAKSGKFDHAVHFVPANQLSARGSANAIHPYYVGTYML